MLDKAALDHRFLTGGPWTPRGPWRVPRAVFPNIFVFAAPLLGYVDVRLHPHMAK